MSIKKIVMNAHSIAVKIDNPKMDPYEAMDLVADWGVGGVCTQEYR